MISKEDCYVGSCDNCGELYEGPEYSLFLDRSTVREQMDESDWYAEGADADHKDKHYCPKCFKYHADIDDKIIVDLSRKKDTMNDKHPTPTEGEYSADDWANGKYPDLSGLNDDDKKIFIITTGMEAAKLLMMSFYTMGLGNFIEEMVINPANNDKFIMSFRKVGTEMNSEVMALQAELHHKSQEIASRNSEVEELKARINELESSNIVFGQTVAIEPVTDTEGQKGGGC